MLYFRSAYSKCKRSESSVCSCVAVSTYNYCPWLCKTLLRSNNMNNTLREKRTYLCHRIVRTRTYFRILFVSQNVSQFWNNLNIFVTKPLCRINNKTLILHYVLAIPAYHPFYTNCYAFLLPPSIKSLKFT